MDDTPTSPHLPQGSNEEDPYVDEDLSTLPDWWRESIEEHRDFGLRPYRPPRFSDGSLLPPIIDHLEEELCVDIDISISNPKEGGQWTLSVDHEELTTLDRTRTAQGYTVYELSPREFERLVQDASKTD